MRGLRDSSLPIFPKQERKTILSTLLSRMPVDSFINKERWFLNHYQDDGSFFPPFSQNHPLISKELRSDLLLNRMDSLHSVDYFFVGSQGKPYTNKYLEKLEQNVAHGYGDSQLWHDKIWQSHRDYIQSLRSQELLCDTRVWNPITKSLGFKSAWIKNHKPQTGWGFSLVHCVRHSNESENSFVRTIRGFQKVCNTSLPPLKFYLREVVQWVKKIVITNNEPKFPTIKIICPYPLLNLEMIKVFSEEFSRDKIAILSDDLLLGWSPSLTFCQALQDRGQSVFVCDVSSYPHVMLFSIND